MINGAMTAVEALQNECDAAIADLRARAGLAKCEAHDAVCRGLIVLLRCQRAQLGQDRRAILVTSVVSAGLAAAATYFATRPPPF